MQWGCCAEDSFVHESIIGQVFQGRLIGRTRIGGIEAIIPEIAGSAHVTGEHIFVVDDDDPLGEGFSLADEELVTETRQ